MKKYDFKKNTVYIPGWMDKASFYPEFRGLEIWEKNIDPKERIEAEYVVAHSLGTHFALLNWKKNKNTKLILINPLLIKKPLKYWMIRFVKYFSNEGKKHSNMKKAAPLKNPINLFEKTKYLLKNDFFKIIEKMPIKNITVIRGDGDCYFCDTQLESLLRERNIPVIVVSGMGHVWNKKVYAILSEIIKN